MRGFRLLYELTVERHIRHGRRFAFQPVSEKAIVNDRWTSNGQHVLHTTGHKTYAYVSTAPEKKTPRTPFCLNEREPPSVRVGGKNACATSAFLLRCRPGKIHRRIPLKMEKSPCDLFLPRIPPIPLPLSSIKMKRKWKWKWMKMVFFFCFSFSFCFGIFEDVSVVSFFFFSYRDIKKMREGENAGFWNSFHVVYFAWTREKLRNLDPEGHWRWKFWIVLPAIAFLGYWLSLNFTTSAQTKDFRRILNRYHNSLLN